MPYRYARPVRERRCWRPSLNYHDRYDEARTWLAARRRDGSLRQRLHVLEGLAQAPIGLGMLFRGENTGKLVVRVAAGGGNDAM